jgi:hypothetical protein
MDDDTAHAEASAEFRAGYLATRTAIDDNIYRSMFGPPAELPLKPPEPWLTKWFGRYGRIHNAWRVLIGRLDPYDGY